MIYFAQKAFIISNGMLLMVRKSSKDPVQAGYWEVPGGRIEEGESIEDHIRREVLEEAGVEIVAGKPFFIWQWKIPRKGNPELLDTVIAVARIASKIGGEISLENQIEDDYLAEIRWVPLADLGSVNCIPNMVPVMAALRVELNLDDKGTRDEA